MRKVTQVTVIVDVFILSPVVLFLLWLFWYSAPRGRPDGLKWLDIGLAAMACTVALAVFSGLHAWLDIEGMDKSIIVVAASYLTFVGMMGLSWLVRWQVHASSSRFAKRGGGSVRTGLLALREE